MRCGRPGTSSWMLSMGRKSEVELLRRKGTILGGYSGIMEKKMETTIVY